MPGFLKILAIVGTAAMIWVGGGILVHGLEGYGLPQIGHAIHAVAVGAAGIAGPLAGTVEWLVTAAGSGLVGLAVGAVLIPVTSFVLAPAWNSLARLRTGAA
jgi:predicted DNA repair protein MutK